jgi:thiol-disulfide isomerase/thioredoxin
LVSLSILGYKSGYSLIKRLILFLSTGLVLGMGLSAFVLAGFNRTVPNQEYASPKPGAMAPDFTLTALDGKPQSLSQYRGKAVIINFWASWCEPCKAEMPLIEEYAEKYPSQLVVLGLNSEETALVAQSFVDSLKIKFPILLDSNGVVSDLYRVDGFPTSIFIDSNGRIQAEQVGSLSRDNMNRYLATLGVKP